MTTQTKFLILFTLSSVCCANHSATVVKDQNELSKTSVVFKDSFSRMTSPIGTELSFSLENFLTPDDIEYKTPKYERWAYKGSFLDTFNIALNSDDEIVIPDSLTISFQSPLYFSQIFKIKCGKGLIELYPIRKKASLKFNMIESTVENHIDSILIDLQRYIVKTDPSYRVPDGRIVEIFTRKSNASEFKLEVTPKPNEFFAIKVQLYSKGDLEREINDSLNYHSSVKHLELPLIK